MTVLEVNSQSETLGLYATLLEDLRVQNAKSLNAWTMLRYLGRPSFRAVFLYRISRSITHKGIVGKITSLILMNINLMLHGCELWPHAIIGPGLFLPHPTGIEISFTHIGRNATIMQKTSFGVRHEAQKNTSPYSSRPVVGNNVFFAPGSVALGSITIGDNAIIAAKTVVLHDVPAHTTMSGIPGRKL